MFHQSNNEAIPTIVLLAADWRRLVRTPEAVVARALMVANSKASVILADDRTVKRLNARHRGQNKPTNVLTFDASAPDNVGEIILAAGVVGREARALQRSISAHLAHLVLHGALHLQGFDHQRAGAAQKMEMTEARLMRRLGLPNPWKHR